MGSALPLRPTKHFFSRVGSRKTRFDRQLPTGSRRNGTFVCFLMINYKRNRECCAASIRAVSGQSRTFQCVRGQSGESSSHSGDKRLTGRRSFYRLVCNFFFKVRRFSRQGDLQPRTLESSSLRHHRGNGKCKKLVQSKPSAGRDLGVQKPWGRSFIEKAHAWKASKTSINSRDHSFPPPPPPQTSTSDWTESSIALPMTSISVAISNRQLGIDNSIVVRQELLKFVDESKFTSSCKDYRDSLDTLQVLHKRYNSAVSFKESSYWNRQINKEMPKLQKHADRIYTGFVCSLNALEVSKSVVRYDKKNFDSAMEDAFGSLNKIGSGLFKAKGIRPMSIDDELNVVRIFSLYLVRKALPVLNPLDSEECDRKFIERISKSRKEPTFLLPFHPSLPGELNNEIHQYLDGGDIQMAGCVMKHLCQVIFRKAFGRSEYISNSGKACTEIPRSKGGKRQMLYKSTRAFDRTNRFKTIMSAGKFRTISLDSAENDYLYGFLNPYMFGEIRKLKCMISGRSVEEWTGDICVPEGSWFLSGDLENATDEFHSVLSEIVLRHLSELFFPEDSESHFIKMCSFTTRAVFDGVRQTTGQLMGSVLSFPILCLVNLTSQLLMHVPYLKIFSMRLDDIREFDKCGINGDDLVTWGPNRDALISAWLRVLPAIGGIPSAGKSLVSRTHFTVNSEIFDKNLRKIKVLRPSLIARIHDGAFRAPQSSWHEYLHSPLRTPRSDKIFRPEKVFFTRFPKSWGGSALEKITEWTEQDYITAIYLKLNKVRPFEGFGEYEPNILPGVSTTDGRNTVFLGGELKNLDGFDRIGGFMKRSDVKEIAKFVYGVRKIAYWKDSSVKRKSISEIEDELQYQYSRLSPYWKQCLRLEYDEAWNMEQDGFVYVRTILDLGQQLVQSRHQGRFMTRPVAGWKAQPTELTEYGFDAGVLVEED